VALEMPALHESTTSHTAFLPEFAYSKLDEIIGELISYGLIEEGSSVTGYTSDTCRVDIISTDTVWNRLKASFATPHLFMGYYGMHVCKKGRLTELRCSAPRVSGLDITSGGSLCVIKGQGFDGYACAVRYLREYLEKQQENRREEEER